MTTTLEKPDLRRAVVMMTVSSFLIPATGVLTAPILARGLGTTGRGELAAALAPAALILPVATLGLPEALTRMLAKHPSVTRTALGWASLVSVVLGVASLGLTLTFLPFLSAGDVSLGKLIVLATALTVPALVVGALRGAATGRQMWREVAAERFVNVVLRVVLLAGLLIAGQLTVYSAVLVNVITPLVSGVVYWRLLRHDPGLALLQVDPDETARAVDIDLSRGPLRPLVAFGSRVWLGAVASMLLGRIGQILMTPLSSAYDLGLYIVASTISDLPLVVALAIQGAVYGVNSRSTDARQVVTTARLTLLVGLIGCVVIGVSLPWWIGPVFGDAFRGAVVPTIMLLVSALICIPGLLAAAGLGAWGRPGLRSIGLAADIVVNVVSFVLLVPHFGVIGACWTSIISNVALTTYLTVVGGRVMGVRPTRFFAIGAEDVRRLWFEAGRVGRALRARLPGRTPADAR